MSALSKEILGTSNYGKTLNGLSTNGFNSKKEDFVDQSKTGSTSKYGRSSWLKAHPSWQVIFLIKSGKSMVNNYKINLPWPKISRQSNF